MDPIAPAAIVSSTALDLKKWNDWLSCPIFSSTVICLIKASTLRSWSVGNGQVSSLCCTANASPLWQRTAEDGKKHKNATVKSEIMTEGDNSELLPTMNSLRSCVKCG